MALQDILIPNKFGKSYHESRVLQDQWNLEQWKGLLIYKLMVLNEPLPLRGFCFQHNKYD